jgi:hypothetical protein
VDFISQSAERKQSAGTHNFHIVGMCADCQHSVGFCSHKTLYKSTELSKLTQFGTANNCTQILTIPKNAVAVFLGKTGRIHWSFDDSAAAIVSEEEKPTIFGSCGICEWLREFLSKN